MKIRWNRIGILVVLIVLFVFWIVYFVRGCGQNQEITLRSFATLTKEEVEAYAKEQGLVLTTEEKYHKTIEIGHIIEQDPKEGTKLKKGDSIHITVSLGPIPVQVYQENGVNELGRVPIMMYHGIIDTPSSETKYTGGNVDKDGYNRTAEAFRKDLEFYYENNYRMIRLEDYIHGMIDVPLGKSPLVLTFDDGREDNFKVLGRNEDGTLQIDPNCAVGVLEEFKKKYPDFGVTATFFVNSGIFQQKEYNQDILKWLVEHGYDVGNHTTTHPDFTKISESAAVTAVGKIYQQLDQLIPGQYVKIVALPFGSPYKKSHVNFSHIMSGDYEGYSYSTEATLRVGWEAEVSPFKKSFDPTFLKRIRAYDNDGKEFDIAMAFDQIKNSRYISDGDKDTIVIPKGSESNLKEGFAMDVITYQ